MQTSFAYTPAPPPQKKNGRFPVSSDTYEALKTEDLFAQMEPSYLYTAPWDMRGYRLESILPDGRLGSYSPGGWTPSARCHSTPVQSLSSLGGIGYAPALHHDLDCSCGYRIVLTKDKLYDFIEHVTKSPSPGSMSVFTNHAFAEAAKDRSGLALVECSIPKGSGLATRNLADEELPGTFRATHLKLGKKVTIPRWCGSLDQTHLAEKVRAKYRVEVTVTDEDTLGFMDSLKPVGFDHTGPTGAGTADGWHSSGEWGLLGASGVLFTAGSSEANEKYLVTRRSSRLPNHPGLWGTPGGAIGKGETTLQAATREVQEELGLPRLGGASIAGAVDYDRPGGWTYTTYLAHVPDAFTPRLDGLELTEHRWVSRVELEHMATEGILIPAFAEKLGEMFELHRTWRSVLDRPRGHTLGGWQQHSRPGRHHS